MYRFSLFITLVCLSLSAFSQDKVDDVLASPQDSVPQVSVPSLSPVDSLTILNDLVLKKDKEISNLKAEAENIRSVSDSSIKDLQAKNEALTRKLISMASNFLYIPYEDYSINNIAIPAFKAAEGTPVYTEYCNRLPMLENYKNDISAIIDFLSGTNKPFKFYDATVSKEEGNKCKLGLEALPCYQRYVVYDDWKNTFLGNYLNEMLKNYNNPTDQTFKNLEGIKSKLETITK